MKYRVYDYLTAEEANLRVDVFVKEQQFSVEFDELDEPNRALHMVFYEDGKCAAVCRAYADEDPECWHIGRIVVRKDIRGGGRGREVVTAAEEECRRRGARTVSLSAQCRAKGFYESCGYSAEGDVYFDEYCEHIKMTKTLD